jgi:hypothetical protein
MAFAEWRYRTKTTPYKSPGITCHCEDFPQLTDWVQTYLRHPYSGRPKSLVIYGDSLIGKTIWARSLGTHAYFPSLFMLEGFNPETSTYAIFDDLIGGLATIPNFKFWLGEQMEFVTGDKYMRKQRIKWGKPCIYICNDDPREEPAWKANKTWLDANTIIVHIDKPLAQPITEE